MICLSNIQTTTTEMYKSNNYLINIKYNIIKIMKKRISATDFIIERCIREAEENCGQELDESLGSWFAKKGAEAKQGLKNIGTGVSNALKGAANTAIKGAKAAKTAASNAGEHLKYKAGKAARSAVRGLNNFAGGKDAVAAIDAKQAQKDEEHKSSLKDYDMSDTYEKGEYGSVKNAGVAAAQNKLVKQIKGLVDDLANEVEGDDIDKLRDTIINYIQETLS